MNKILGISSGFHNAAYALVEGREILSAEESERFTRKKNDPRLNIDQLDGMSWDQSAFYERPFKKNIRRLIYGQGWAKRTTITDNYVDHHWSHAAGSYYTRPNHFLEPVCVVIDAIGEWDTASIWFRKKKVWSMRYPKSLGLFYSAVTKEIGYTPNEDEHVTMALAAYGEPIHADMLLEMLHGNCHKGLPYDSRLLYAEPSNLAASAQLVLEIEIVKIMNRARKYSEYLCYSGGVALNCVANTKIHGMFKDVWIMPNPGDAGAALGCAAAINNKRLIWRGSYLGHNIKREINPKEVAEHLEQLGVAGVANGRGEFGPRALGNRSILADPRGDIKLTVDRIKKRQSFRPFAPAILEEHAVEYFEGPMNEYMQFVAKAKHDYKSVTHVDGTSRVQVVTKDCGSVIRPILEEWYDLTGCPMLLNTSMNTKGKPMVRGWGTAMMFQAEAKVKIF